MKGGPKIYAVGARVSEVPVPEPNSELLAKGKIKLSVPDLRRERTKNYRQLPFGSVPTYAPLSYDRNDPETIKNAYLNRLLRPVPEADPGWLKEFHDHCVELAARLPKVVPMTFQEWLDSESYPGWRKNQLREEYDKLNGHRPSMHTAKKVKSFVKLESYPLWKAPRMINSRCDAFKAWAGGYIKAIESVVYDVDFDGIKFVKHIPVPDRPAAIMNLIQAGSVSMETDYKTFECSFAPKIMHACECALLTHCLADYPEDAMYLARVDSGLNKMSTRNGVRAEVKGRRMSGDLWTSLGNGWTNMCLAHFVAAKRGIKIKGFVEGDDGLFVASGDIDPADFTKLGFTCEMKIVRSPAEAHFCGMIFSDSGQIVKDPRRVFENFGWTHSSINAGPRVMNELLRAKCLSGCYETPHCPVIGVLYREGLRRTRGSIPRFERDGYHDMGVVPTDESKVPEFAPTPSTRELFAQKFNVPESVQLLAEEAIRDGDLMKVASLIPAGSDLDVYDYAIKYIEPG